MPSLWGSKTKDNGEETGEGRPESRPDSRSMREPTERDRLLPDNHRRPPHADGYLDPDDPAVSDRLPRTTTKTLMFVGIAIQPVDRPIPAISLHPLPRYYLPVVGAAPR